MIEEVSEKKSLSKRALVPFGCLGWTLFAIGSAYLVQEFWLYIWEWLLFALGVFFCYRAFKGNDKQYLFPGTILLVLMGALICRKFGLLDFPLWKFWPILFIGTGLAFIILYTVRDSRIWVLIPGGALLLAGGGGIGYDSWWKYQHWLRGVADLWPILIIGIGTYMIWNHWRKTSDKMDSKIET